MPLNSIASLSKCCFVIFLTFVFGNIKAQNTITVKKKQEPQKEEAIQKEVEEENKDEVISIDLNGFYYSDPYTLGTGIPGEPPSDFRRMLLYIDEYNRVYIFHSTKPVKKVFEKFNKDPKKLTEETGNIELTSYGGIFINSNDIYSAGNRSGYSSFKYTGSLITENVIYLEYKASYHSKVALKINLHRY